MATTTTNYGWDIPQSTDLVKDGATAIATLGQDIDTSVYTALGGNKSGMVHLSTVAFSAVSSVSLPANTFSATYNNYRVLLQIDSASTGTNVKLRLRASGSDNTTANYHSAAILNFSYNGAYFNDAGNGTNISTQIVGIDEITKGSYCALDISSPYLAKGTFITLTSSGGYKNLLGQCFHNSTTLFDSMTFIPDSGNFTGKVYAYGYNI